MNFLKVCRGCIFALAAAAVVAFLMSFVGAAHTASGQTLGVPPVLDPFDSGIIFNRDKADSAAPDSRTQPYAPDTAPLFESIPPATQTPPAATPSPGEVVHDPLYPTPTALTPEQKQALKGLLIQAAVLLMGALLGSGSMSPFMAMILEKLLGALKGAQPDAAKPARTRRRVSRAKKKAAPAK